MRLPRLSRSSRLSPFSRVLTAIAFAAATSSAASIAVGLLAPSVADAKQPAAQSDNAAAAARPARAKNGGKSAAKTDASKTDAAKTDASKTDASKSEARKAGQKGDPKARANAPRAAAGTQSIGSPNRGRLTGGMRLRPTKHIEIRPYARTWGLPELVRLLRRASEEVAKKHSGSVLYVGDLAAKAGGPIDGHNSHQSGRDVDIGFFAANTKGRPVHMKRFIAFDASGKAPKDVSWVRFDDARNWSLVEALVNDPNAGVRYIFVSNALRARLLGYAAKKQVPKDVIARVAAAMMSPREADLHDDHFHVRIACPESMIPGCSEESSAREGAPVAAAVSAEAAPSAKSAASGAADRASGAGAGAADRASGIGVAPKVDAEVGAGSPAPAPSEPTSAETP
jgi:penicillin-insensitive murein endopeptidase